MVQVMAIAASAWFLTAGLQAAEPQRIKGTFTRLTAEAAFTQFELSPSQDRNLPGVRPDDRVYRATLPQFRIAGATMGLPVAFVETASGGFLFVDANFDGKLTEDERVSAAPQSFVNSRDSITIDLKRANSPVLPLKCGVISRDLNGESRRYLMYAPSFRAEGYADIGGTRTLIGLPYSIARADVDIRRGMIGIDLNNDGRIERDFLVAGESSFVNDEALVFKVHDRYVSFESADFTAGSFVLREHGAEDYVMVALKVGIAPPDFPFTDQRGVAGNLSDFKGKYLLLDFWGTWCKPCVAEIPDLKDIYARFRDRGFEILGMDQEMTAAAPVTFLADHGMTWRNTAPASVDDLIRKRFRIMAFPTHILLDPNGVIVEFPLNTRDLTSTLNRLLPPKHP